jgi:hypothetical protein
MYFNDMFNLNKNNVCIVQNHVHNFLNFKITRLIPPTISFSFILLVDMTFYPAFWGR